MAKKQVDSWVISGREAEVLHMEEEDFSDPEKDSEEEDDDDDDPIKKIIQSRYYFSLHNIFENRVILYISCHCIIVKHCVSELSPLGECYSCNCR